MKPTLAAYKNTGFFALRTPLLPYSQFFALSDGAHSTDGGAASTPAEQRARVRGSMLPLVRNPIVREALFLASPGLEGSLPEWERNPDSDAGRRVESALYRYLCRMCTRATPFGLFAGMSKGRLTKATELRLGPREQYRRFTRVDNDYVSLLLDTINAEPSFRSHARYFPNSSAYESCGKLRYAEAISDPERRERTYRLVSVDLDEHLELVLRVAAAGARIEDMVRGLLEHDGTLEEEDARAYVDSVIDSQIVVSTLGLAVTGREPLDDAIEELAAAQQTEVCDRLRTLRDRVHELDGRPLGVPRSAYEEIFARVQDLPVPAVELGRLFQVNLHKPLSMSTLGSDVLVDVRATVASLYRIQPALREPDMEQLVAEFRERYGDRVIPLAEALDPETGVGLDRERTSALEASPVLDGLQLDQRPPDGRGELTDREVHLLGLLRDAWRRHERELALTEQDLQAMEARDRGPMPSSFDASFELARRAGAEDGVDILFNIAYGPPGVRLLGRFCHEDQELTTIVRGHVRAEADTFPDAVLADIVHLPEGRLGNVACRPVLAEYEIPYLGKAGAPRQRQIPLSDLALRLDGARLVLISRRLGREVVPRLTNAHASENNTIRTYRFLTALQRQGCTPAVLWTWGPLVDAPHLPRVRIGSVLVSRERWTVTGEDLKRLARAGDQVLSVAADLRNQYTMPRFVALADGDNELAVDLENVVSLDALVAATKNRPRARFVELWPASDGAFVEGPEGRYVAQVVVPFVRTERAAGRAFRASARDAGTPRASARSADLLLRLHAPESSGDDLLRESILPLVAEWMKDEVIDRWRFARVPTPRWHLALVLHPGLRDGAAEALASVHDACRDLQQADRILGWSIEAARPDEKLWGGSMGVELAEQLEWHDSRAVASLVEGVLPAVGEEGRWLLAARGVVRLLADFGYDPPQRLERLEELRSLASGALRPGPSLDKQLVARYHEHASTLDALVADVAGESWLPEAESIFAERSDRFGPVLLQLREHVEGARVTCSWDELARKIVHLFANRIFRSAVPAHELVVFDFLHRAHRARLGRLAARGSEVQ